MGVEGVAPELGVRIHERDAGHRLGVDSAQACGSDAQRARSTRDGRPGYERVHAAGSLDPPVRRARLRSRAVTEPLTDRQRASIGWERRQGFADTSNRFHYFRTTEDGRILWGGYDAVYHWRNGVDPRSSSGSPRSTSSPVTSRHVPAARRTAGSLTDGAG